MANISIDVADNEARQDLQDLEDYVDSAAFDKQSLSVTENGTYTAPAGKAYSPVVVDVPNTYAQSDEGKVVSSGALVSQTTRNVTTNGTYDTTTNNSVVVEVQEQPWQPLEDGYSNFWFELTDDTLSPWLNFSAKNNDAVIDWGDGTGEVALDTLTPTHTYSKAGRYVVKCKGVTGIAAQHTNQMNDGYFNVLRYVELNNDLVAVQYAIRSFAYCAKLKKVVANTIWYTEDMFYQCGELESVTANAAIGSISRRAFCNCYSLKDVTMPSDGTQIGQYAFGYAYSSLKSINSVASTITRLDKWCFAECSELREIHIQATAPPVLEAGALNGLPSDYIFYVPVGYGETYKAAAGWSAYADHILEEGEVVTRAMKAKFTQNNQNE